MKPKNPPDMNLNNQAQESVERWYGVFSALVTDIVDPDGKGRVKVMLPNVADPSSESKEIWARLSTSTDRHHRGRWSIPESNDEVLVAFEGGDPDVPIIIGSLWNGSGSPTDPQEESENSGRYILQTRNGIKVTLDDTGEQEQLILETPNGQKLMMKDNPDSIEIIDNSGNSIRLEVSGITINTPAKVTINASLMDVSTGFAKFSGVVQCDTLITNLVVSAVYTPGAGGIW